MARLPLRHPGLIGMIIPAFMLLPLSTDMYLASLPGLQREFAVSVPEAQLTLSVFVVGFALSQLVCGPLSDRYGRRPVLLAGLAVYVAASLACLFAPSIGWLIAARFVQALGACAGVVVGRAILRDVYDGPGAARVLSLTMAGTALGPILAPMLGGALESAFGWRASFVALAAVGGALLTATSLLLAESNLQRDPTSGRIGRIAANYRSLLGHRRFVGYMLCYAFGYCAIFTWLSMSSFVIIGGLGMSPRSFGVMFGLSVFGYVTGTLIAARLAPRAGIDRLLAAGAVIGAIAGVLMLGLALAGVAHAAALFLPFALLLVGMGLVNPVATAGAIAPFPKMAGTASALLGFAQMATGAAYGFVAARLHGGGSLAMVGAIALASVATLACYLLLVRGARAPRPAQA